MNNTTYDFGKIDEFIEKMQYYYDICGLAVGIGDKEGLLFCKSAGIKNIATGEKIKDDDIFHMASLTKLFVSTCILQLIDAGKVSLKEKLTAYLPSFYIKNPVDGGVGIANGAENHCGAANIKDDGQKRSSAHAGETTEEWYRQITIYDLITHTAGMPDCKDYEWDSPRTDEAALSDYVNSLKDRHLLWTPGDDRFFYSNIGYEVLGAVIAQVSQMPFEDYVKKHIFDPLHMKDSTLLTFERDMSEVCSPHYKNEDKHFEICKHFPYNRSHAPSSTLTSNIKDLAKFAAAHMGGTGCEAIGIPKDENSQSSFSGRFVPRALVPNNKEHMGLGWFIRSQGKYTLYGHEGMDDGFRASLWICPDADLFIAVCANSDNSPVKKLNRQIFDLLTESE